MKRSREYLQHYNINGQMSSTAKIGTQYCPKIKHKKGRWSGQEHHIFITCLKKYGKDWDRLEELIPTRSGMQIRSHCQKYLDQIKKEYNTDNPMEYILKNMCDKSPYYQFDLPQLTDPVQNPQVQMMMEQNQSENFPIKERPQRNTYLKHKKQEILSDSSGYFNGEDSNIIKKRNLKCQMKSIKDLNFSSTREDTPFQRDICSSSSQELSKIQKCSKNSQESISNSNNGPQNINGQKSIWPNRASEQKLRNDIKLKATPGSTILLLNKGKIAIQANMILSNIPAEILK